MNLMWLNQASIHAFGLLAQLVPEHRWQEMRDAWRHDSPNSTPLPVNWILGIGAVLVLLIVTSWVKQWIRKRRDAHAPLASFDQMMRDLGVGWSDRKLLIRIAQQQKLPAPLTLVLSGETLSFHAAAYAGVQPTMYRNLILSRAAALRLRLFGTTATQVAAES